MLFLLKTIYECEIGVPRCICSKSILNNIRIRVKSDTQINVLYEYTVSGIYTISCFATGLYGIRSNRCLSTLPILPKKNF